MAAMEYGYCRVSTDEQELALQLDAMHRRGIPDERIYVDTTSGAKASRPRLDELMRTLQDRAGQRSEVAALHGVQADGDTLVVWKLDRLGRSLAHLISIANELAELGVDLVSITQNLDTSTPFGKAIFYMTGLFAELERDLIRERTLAGLAAARARGRHGGRKPRLGPEQAKLAQRLYDEKGPDGRRAHTVQYIADQLGVPRATVYGYLNRQPTTAAGAA